MPINALAFDLDGTLIDSLPDLAASANHVRSHYGLSPLPQSTIETYIGDGVQELIHRTLTGRRDGRDPERIDDALALHRDYYGSHLTVHTRPYPAVPETLRALHQQGIPMALVTNKPEKHARTILETLSLSPYFTAIFGGDSCSARKPSPVPVLAAAQALGAPPENLLMVGDSPNDILAGKAAGCQTLLVTYGYTDIPALLADPATQPDCQIDAFAELPALLLAKNCS